MNVPYILYAPNVHVGGGFVLLRGLLLAWPSHLPLTVFLDERARERLPLSTEMNVRWVRPTIFSRLAGEISLRSLAIKGRSVLCFHGLPPWFRLAARVVVYQQNRNYLGLNRLSQFPWRTRLRIAGERRISRWFRRRVAEYIVQTPTMQRSLTAWYGGDPNRHPLVRVLPFVDALPPTKAVRQKPFETDFVYVADGGSHKNHRLLLAAWILLAEVGIRPSLFLTLGISDHHLIDEIKQATVKFGLCIHNKGSMSREEVLALYERSGAMVYPSTSESFGLPLIEADHVGLPIIAAELDYVREVCTPIETFDPTSPVSIARAVRRYLGCPEPVVALMSPTDFWREIIAP